MKKFILNIILFFPRLIKRLKRRFIIAKAYVKLQKAFRKQLKERKRLKSSVNDFLIEFFAVNAKSKYIPRDFKNNEEVREAVVGRFGERMDQLNVKFADLFN